MRCVLQVAACSREEVATLLSQSGSNGNSPSLSQAVRDFVSEHGATTLQPEEERCSLWFAARPFDAVKTFGKPAKPPRSGTLMPPVHDQLQLAANHFATGEVCRPLCCKV